MKMLITMMCLLGLSVSAATQKSIPVSNVYTPMGFDSNDNSEVIVSGFYPNLCYRNAKYELTKTNQTIKIKVFATYLEDTFCPEVVVPFLKVVDLGVMNKGKYKIEVTNPRTQTIKDRIYIKQQSAGQIDQYTYPLVDYVKTNLAKNEITIQAFKPSSCYEFDRVEFVNDQKDVLTVLPIMKKIRSFCPKKMTPLTIKAKLPQVYTDQRFLLHVRSLSDTSKNKIIDKRNL